MSRTPGASKQLPEYVDVWGRETDTGNLAQRFWDNFFDIASTQEIEITPVDKEIIRLYAYPSGEDTITRPDVIPPSSKVIQITVLTEDGNEENKVLTAHEIVAFKKVRGATAYSEIESLINTSAYDKISDDAKALAISYTYDYAQSQAKMSLGNTAEKEIYLKMANEFGGLPRSVVFCCRAVKAEAEAKSKEDILKALNSSGLGAYANDYYYYYESEGKEVKNLYQEYLSKNKLNKHKKKGE